MRAHRRRWIAAAALVAAALAADLWRPPERQLTARALVAGIGAYQRWGSPALGRAGVRCRFLPSCSRYAEISIRRRGALAGTAAAIVRVARCGPWTEAGTVDPPG